MSDLLFEKETKCLFCEENFISQRVRNSKVAISKKDTDFCNYYTNEENPYFYEVWVCPHCGFAFNTNFKPLTTAQKEVAYQDYSKRIGTINFGGKRSLEDALQAFKLALVCASISEQESVVISNIFLRIAWFYRFQGKKEEETKYLAKASESFQDVFENGDSKRNPAGEHKIIYLLGELNGRLGKYEEARRWFNMLLSQHDIEPAIKNLARDQWMLYKSMMA